MFNWHEPFKFKKPYLNFLYISYKENVTRETLIAIEQEMLGNLFYQRKIEIGNPGP